MVRQLWALVLSPACAVHAADSPSLTADQIMARVAVNQDKAEKLRGEYIYQQRIRIATRRTNGKLMREEIADYQVTPSSDRTQKELKTITGRYWHKGNYLAFDKKPVPEADSLDGDLIHDFRDELANEESRDAMAHDLFPLTAGEQKKYRFELAGEESLHGRRVYRVKFRPRDKNDLTWAGEARVDAEEFQPVSVFTRLSRGIPIWVRTLLGTNLSGIGFNVEYRRFEGGVWFPTSLGTEFRLHAIFFINRDITISLENSGFKRTKVDSRILEYKEVE